MHAHNQVQLLTSCLTLVFYVNICLLIHSTICVRNSQSKKKSHSFYQACHFNNIILHLTYFDHWLFQLTGQTLLLGWLHILIHYSYIINIVVYSHFHCWLTQLWTINSTSELEIIGLQLRQNQIL